MARNKRSKKIIGTELILMVIGIIITIIVAIIADQIANKQKENLGLSAELARAKTYDRVEKGEEAVEGTENVKFDAFFLRDLEENGYATGVRGTCKAIGEQDTLYMEINIQTAGHLKDAKITIDGKNFYLQTTLPKDEQLANSYIGNNIKEIKFNDLTNGTQKLITGIVRSGDYSYSSTKASAIGNSINNYSRNDNKIILTGTYVDENGEETSITKEVPLTMDWYGTTKASIYSTTQNRYIEDCINEKEGTINLDFTVDTEETDEKLILKTNHTEGEIPELNGYAPTSVVCTETNIIFNYDETTRKFAIDRISKVGENGEIENLISMSNNYELKVTYPLEAYQSLGTEQVTIKIPVNTYYEGYNNPNEEFSNPYKSNVAKSTILVNYEKTVGTIARFEVVVGKPVYNPTYRYIVSKQKPLKIYNGQSEKEEEDIYIVQWRAYIGTNTELDGLVMKETKDGESQETDKFIKTNATTETTEDSISNIGIYFEGADRTLGEEGWIKIYDENTGNLLETFTKKNWNQYTKSNPYKYEVPVKHIKMETSKVIRNEVALYVYNVKEIDDEIITTKYEKKQFKELQYIESTLEGYIGTTHINTSVHQANYEAPMSTATIEIDKNVISTQFTEKNVKITVATQVSESNNLVKWKDGTFLIKFPEEMIDVQVNNVSINNSSVKIENYEVIEQNGEIFIKIVTNNITPQSYTITIDADLSPDPRKATTTRDIELYATNENGSDYYYKTSDTYDINNNLNTTEQVNYLTASISMVSPNSLLTNQTASNYDEKGSIVVSPKVADIKPIYAVVDQEKQEQTAQIGLQLRNNYASTISEIEILGKIPFEGNTYTISGNTLNSTFTTKIANTGIEIPEEIRNVAIVYYSENENPDKDLTNEENNWKRAENVENWNNIKTFLIDLGNYVMPVGKELVFNYTVVIPDEIEFNKISYSHHGVYFCLDTENGKYRTQTEPNRLGFRIAEKYDLKIEKHQKGKEKIVPGATYSITEIIQNEDGTEIKGEAKTAVTNNKGILNITNLYAKKLYEIRETKTPDDYEINTDVIRFISNVDEFGVLTIDKISGETIEDIAVTKEEGENYKAIVKVEDEVKTRLKITKKEKDTENRIRGVRYKLTGYNLPETGKTVTTNINGEVSINGLSVGKEYTLEEVKAAEGYYLSTEKITFKIVNNEGNYVTELLSENVKDNNITEENDIPTLNIVLENEKIPTYDLEITKVKKTIDVEVSNTETEEGTKDKEITYLAGAKFKLYKDARELGEFVTDETGKVTINNLYQYVENKDENATYTLKEVLAPEGYAKVKDITFKVQENEGLKFINIDENENKYTVEENTIKLVIEDSPSFKLIKKDGETGELLSNIKFAIYNIENGQKPATNSKGEILGVKELINGKEYYTLSTDNNGEITADLTEGLYKAVEVQAPDKYDISNQTYYFGIGSSSEGTNSLKAEWGKAVGGEGDDEITCITETLDGGYIVVGHFASSSLDLGNGIVLNNFGEDEDGNILFDAMIIKYSEEGNVEWGKAVGGEKSDYINCITETRDGGCIIGGYFYSSSIDLGNGVVLTNKSFNTSYSDGMLIKYGADGEVEWGKAVGGTSDEQITCITEMTDGKYVIGGVFQYDTIDLGNGVVLDNNGNDDGMLIKYNEEGNVEWGKTVGGHYNDEITCITETSEGGYLVGGNLHSESIDLGNGVVLTNKSLDASYCDGMLIKYGADGEVEWGKVVGGDKGGYINCITETQDGGYLVGGNFHSESIDLGNGEVLNNNGSSDGMIIKYGINGEVEWGKAVGGEYADEIICITETRDGDYSIATSDFIYVLGKESKIKWKQKLVHGIKGIIETVERNYIVVGDFNEENIDLGNGIVLNSNYSGAYDGIIVKYNKIDMMKLNIEQGIKLGENESIITNCVIETSDGGYAVGGYFYKDGYDLGGGVIIKYGENGKVEWEKTVGEKFYDRIACIIETSDRGYIVGGYFESKNIDLGNEVVLNNKSMMEYGINAYYNDGMLIKYGVDGEVEWGKAVGGSRSDYIKCIVETRDGGYLVGGSFASETIDLGNGVVLNSNNNSIDGMLIKYGSDGEVEWGKAVGGEDEDEITCITETSEGGYLVGGYFESISIDLGNGVMLNNNDERDGMLIKYNEKGNVEWGKAVGGEGNDEITCITETQDRGYIVGGYFSSSSIELGNGVVLKNKSSIDDEETYEYYADGMLIKYGVDGKVEWGKAVGGEKSDSINCITETRDGGCIIGGKFSSTIELTNEIVLIPIEYETTMIIKYEEDGEIGWASSVEGVDIVNVIEKNNKYILGGNSESNIETEDGLVINNNGLKNGVILSSTIKMGVPEVQELVIENKRKEFKITTEVKEIEGIKGGNISGEDQKPYETVKYGDKSTKEIIITPEEEYEIIEITVNGKEYPFETNEDGTYKMPQFDNITENKHIVVTFALKDNKIIINKVDADTKIPLMGAKFRLDQIEERTNPENVIGEMVANGQEYNNIELKNEISGSIGSLVNNGEYYFTEQEGKYVPKNVGIDDTTANSYIEIDLTNKTGNYAVVVNAEVSSEEGFDNGYATITDTTDAISYDDSEKFIDISGEIEARDYTSSILEGGKKYYLHLGYIKDGSGENGEDKVTFNSIKVYEAEETRNTYNFIENEGKYESNNQGKDNKVANSYIPIDLTENTGKYNLTVNAEVSSQEWGDYGYATITEDTVAPGLYDEEGQFIQISGEQEAKDYTTVLQGGRMYYLHLGYYKDGSGSEGEDKFTVNSVKITLNSSELYNTEIETNSQGQAVTQIPFGKYKITEIKAPEGYLINEEPIEIEFTADGEHEFTIENQKSSKVKVHHYKAIKNADGSYTYTEEEVAESEILEGKIEERYTSIPHLDINKYELEKDENGEYVIPENATGKFAEEETEVIYYYVEKLIPVTVHHYLEGTEERITIDGKEVEDEILIGRIDETFETTPYENLPTYYEYVSSSNKTSGEYKDGPTEIVYYYRIKEYNYKVEYYYNDQKDEEATEEGKEEYGKEITGYINKPKEGYKFEKEENIPLKITENEENNVIKIYYVTESVSYTVNYLEEDTNDVLHEAKIVNDQKYGATIITSSEIIDIEGYEYSSINKEKITLEADATQNIINIYYIKRSDLKYTVNYLEKETNKELHESKIVKNQVYGGTITSSTEVIEIPGYNYDSIDKESITIQIDETQNVINIYYTIKTDIKYKVEYYYNGIKNEEETEEYTATYKDVIEEYEDKIKENYVLVEEKGIPLEIGADETKNIIEVYYAKETTATVKYIDQTTNEIIEEKTEEGYVGKEFVTEAKDFEGYILVEEPEEKTVLMEEDEVVLKYYYVHISSGVIEKHIDIDTNEILDNATYEGNEGDNYKTEAKEFKGYELVKEKYPENAEGKMEREAITVTYYYKKKAKATVTIKYIDKETNEEIEENIVITGYEGDEYKTEQKELEGYEFIEVTGKTEGSMSGEKEIIYYYQKIKEPEIPGEGGDDPVIEEPKEPQDPTAIDKEIPSAGLTKEQIAIIVVIVMSVIAGVLVVIAIKGTILSNKYKNR